MKHRTMFPGLEAGYRDMTEAAIHAHNLHLAAIMRTRTEPGVTDIRLHRHWKDNARLALQCAASVRIGCSIQERLP